MCLLPLRVATDPCPGAMSSKVAEDPSDADVTAFLTATREGRVESGVLVGLAEVLTHEVHCGEATVLAGFPKLPECDPPPPRNF